MSFVATVGNVIKGAYRNIKMGLMTVENPEYGVEIAKEKIKNLFKTIFKTVFYQILSYALVLVIIIASVGVVFEIFMFLKSITNPYDIEVNEMKEWADELSDEEIEEMQEFGANIHPQKIGRYLEIEENSYPKNIMVKTPITTKVWENDNLVSEEKEYREYLLKRGDETYPYRQWWQSVAVLDIINETSIHKRKWDIVNDAERELSPSFKWTNPLISEMKEGDIYKEGSGHELIITTTTETIRKEFPIGFDGDIYTDITKKQVKEYYPLANLEEVSTMFAKHSFNYTEEESSTGDAYNEPSYTTTRTEYHIGPDGKLRSKIRNYQVKVYVNVTTTTKMTSASSIAKEFTDKFLTFLDEHDIDTNSDPEVMYLMAEQMPQNFDFLSEFGEYLYYMDDMVLYGEFRGGFGNFAGDYEILQSDLIRKVPLFLQTDPRWKSVPYSYTGNVSHGTIGTSACGPTSAAMIITGLGGYNESIDLNGDGVIDPYETTMYSLKKGHRIYGQGTAWSYFADVGSATGLNVSQKSPNQYRDVLDELQKGNPVVASMGPGVFTKGGHYIVLVGINENGKIIVNDPNSTSRSNVAWNFYNPILAQAKQFWIFSK